MNKFYVAKFKSPNGSYWYQRPQPSKTEALKGITTVNESEKFLGIQKFTWKRTWKNIFKGKL